MMFHIPVILFESHFNKNTMKSINDLLFMIKWWDLQTVFNPLPFPQTTQTLKIIRGIYPTKLFYFTLYRMPKDHKISRRFKCVSYYSAVSEWWTQKVVQLNER